jgi:hypothetical protein
VKRLLDWIESLWREEEKPTPRLSFSTVSWSDQYPSHITTIPKRKGIFQNG